MLNWPTGIAVSGLFVPRTIRTLDYSYIGLLVWWTFHTTDDSYYGLFVPCTNITCATKVNVYMCVCLSVCLSVSLLTLCTRHCIEVILALQFTSVRCRYFVRINMFILSSRCCLFDAVLQYTHVAGNCLSRQLLGGMQRGGRGFCANYR